MNGVFAMKKGITIFLVCVVAFVNVYNAEAQTSTIQLITQNKPYQRGALQQIGWDAKPLSVQLPNQKTVWLMVLASSQMRNYSSITITGKTGDSIQLKLTAVNLWKSSDRKKWTDYPSRDTVVTFIFKEPNQYYYVTQEVFSANQPAICITLVPDNHKAVKKENRRKRRYATFNNVSGELEVADWDALKPPQ